MDVAVEHVRLEVAKAALAPDLFADFYRFGAAVVAPPLICYWGGAIAFDEYEARRRRQPSRLVAELEAVIGNRGLELDLLVVSSPETTPRSRTQLRRDVATFYDGLLLASPNPRPSTIGYLGYSAGAWVAIGLALDLPASSSVATIGGVGMSEGLVGVSHAALQRVQFASFVNRDDPVASETYVFQNALAARGLPLRLDSGRGRHEWDDYAANGLVRRGLAWVVAAVAGD